MSSLRRRHAAVAGRCVLAAFILVAIHVSVASARPLPDPGSPGPQFSPPFSARGFADPAAALRPKYRWWQPVAATSNGQIAAEVNSMAADGGGGFEQNGFPVTMNNDGQTVQFENYANSQEFNAIFGWGTLAWSDRTATYETTAARDGVIGDMTEGSRWNNSVPSVLSQNQPAAAQQLVFGDAQLKPGSAPGPELPPIQTGTAQGGLFGPTTIGEPSGVSTELCEPVKAGDANLQLQSIAGLLAGDHVTVGLGSQSETATIKHVGTASPCVPLSGAAHAGDTVVHVPQAANDSSDFGGLGVVSQTSAATSAITGVPGTGMEPAQFTPGERIVIGSGPTADSDTIATVGTFDNAAPTTVAAGAGAGATHVELARTSGFLRGDTITFDPGQSDQQSRTITSVGAAGTGTTLSTAAGAGDLGIRVADTSGLSAGNVITIDPGHADAETVTVASVNSTSSGENVLLQDAALAHGHTAGERVVLTGIGVHFAPALSHGVTDGTTATDTGTGLRLAKPLAHGHTAGDGLVAPGSGVTLTAPLARAHAVGPNSASQTTVAAAAGAGATTLPVASANGLNAGDSIIVGAAGFTEQATIASVGATSSGGTALRLKAPLARSHFAGDPVIDVFARSARATTLAATAAPGQTNVRLADISGLSAGDTLTFGASGSASEIATIKTVGTAGAGGTGVTLTGPLSYAHAQGQSVSNDPGANPSAGVSDVAEQHLVAVEFAQCASGDAATCPSGPTGGTRDLDPSSVQIVTGQVRNGALHYTANGGRLPLGNGNPWEEIALYQTADGQTLNGATATTPNYWLDHLSAGGAQAMADYFDDHILNNPATAAAIRQQDLRTGKPAVFEDSLELSSNLKWTSSMLSEWESQLGYDPTALLPAIAGEDQDANSAPVFDFTQNDGHGATLGWRVREDYRQLWNNLYTARYQQTLDNWAASHGLVARFQAYGDPIDAGEAGAHEGIPEGEHLEFASDDETQQFKVVASGSYQTGNRVVSDECCEEFGTTFGGTYGVDGRGSGPKGSSILSNANSAYADIVGGDNQIIWHGWPYNPYPAGSAAVWPGNSFGGDQLVAAAYGPNNPQFTDNRQENLALGRVALAMRQGQPSFDVAVYHQDLGLAGQGADNLTSGENLGTRVTGGQTATPTTGQLLRSSSSLAQTGYTYGYVSPAFFRYPTARYGADRAAGDGRVLFPGHGNYRALVIYNQSVMPVDVAEKLLSLARHGLPVLIVGQVPDATASARPGTVSGFATQDALVQAAMAKLTALPNVKVVADARAAGSQSQDANAPAALRGLGITASTGLSPTSTSATAQPVLTERRHDARTGTDLYFLFNPDVTATVYPTVNLAGRGTPYRLDAWGARISPIATYTASEGHVRLSLRIAPGNFALIAISRRDPSQSGMWDRLHATATTANATPAASDNLVFQHGRLVARAATSGRFRTTLSNGRAVTTAITVPRLGSGSAAAILTDWQLWVDSFGPTPSGDPTQTQHTRIPARGTITVKPLAGTTDATLPSWTAITPQNGFPVGDNLTNVAGIGTYTTSFTLPSTWSTRSDGAFLNIGVAVDTVDIWINGTAVAGIDQNDRNQIDVGPYLRPGANTIKLTTATPLQNAVDVAPSVPATGQIPNSSNPIGSLQGAAAAGPFGGGVSKDANMGLIGPVTLTPYGQAIVPTRHRAAPTHGHRHSHRRR